MVDLSVIIPAKNEIYLERTIRNVLSNIRGNTEIIVVLDNYIPNPQINISDKRVIFLYFPFDIGQRRAVNEGVKYSTATYIMKLDAHCAVDEGFDVKLMEDCKYDWTVVPRMYNLDSETWKPKLHKRTDYMYISSPTSEKPFRATYYGRNQPKSDKLIDDTMCCMGPCFFMNRQRYWDLGGMDENHGGWGQMGIELSLKAWISGGYFKVNKNTWFAHWFRTNVGFPYQLSGKQVAKARKYSQDLWLNNKWDKAKRDFRWVVDKFEPPGWVNDLTLIYYTSNKLSKKIAEPVIRSLKRHNLPIISVSQEQMDLGNNIVVPKHRSVQNIYRQVLIGAKEAKTKYVALVEDDCLYTNEHFKYRPKTFAYNLNRWMLHLDKKVYSYRKRPILSQCIANRDVLIKNLEERFKLKKIYDKDCGEMGLYEKALGMQEYSYEIFETEKPNLVICHDKNTVGRKYLGRDAPLKKDISVWGNVEYWVRKFSSEEKSSQHSYIRGYVFAISDLYKNRMEYADNRKPESCKKFIEVFRPFILEVHNGKRFTNKELESLPYYNYLLDKLNPKDKNPLSKKGNRHCINLMKNAIKLYNDIKSYGLKAPLDMWRERDKLVLHRGGRRLEILHILGYKTVPVRIFKSKEIFRKYSPSILVPSGEITDSSIHSLAIKQFSKLLDKSTDKYWIHGYTPLYDFHLSNIKDKVKKVLEIGVLRGASLLLWKEVFPNAQIYGIDKNTKIWKSNLEGKDRIKVFVGHQEDIEFLKKDIIPDGKYDIIIDDGGHKANQQKTSFSVLWNALNSGGFYVIEDLFGNYRRKIQNDTIDMIKDLIDDMHLKSEIKSISCYYNICFIEKR